MTEQITERPTIEPNDPPAIDDARLAEIETRALAAPEGEGELQGRQDTLDLIAALRQAVEKAKQAEAKCAELRQKTERMLLQHKERIQEMERDLDEIKALLDEIARTGLAPVSVEEPLH